MEYKVIGYNWNEAYTHGSVYGNGYQAYKYEAMAAESDLNKYAASGWRVISTWRTDSGTAWFVLER